MEQLKLGDMENRFAQLIWENEPISSRKLTELCEVEFSWKRTTTYTMLKRLCQRGIFENKAGSVTSLISKEEFKGLQSQQFVSDTFGGSLPEFLVAFTGQKRLSKKEVAEIQNFIDCYKED